MDNLILMPNDLRVSEVAEQAILQVANGEIDPVVAISNLAKMKLAIDKVEKDARFRDAVMVEVEKYGARHIDVGDIHIEMADVGVRYDFSGCNDPQYSRLSSYAMMAGEELKEREKFLKNLPAGGIMELDEETGEVNKITPPVKKSKSWIKITVKNK